MSLGQNFRATKGGYVHAHNKITNPEIDSPSSEGTCIKKLFGNRHSRAYDIVAKIYIRLCIKEVRAVYHNEDIL